MRIQFFLSGFIFKIKIIIFTFKIKIKIFILKSWFKIKILTLYGNTGSPKYFFFYVNYGSGCKYFLQKIKNVNECGSKQGEKLITVQF